MNNTTLSPANESVHISLTELNNIKFEEIGTAYVAILIDTKNHPIIRGYGKTRIAALNDLHSCLL